MSDEATTNTTTNEMWRLTGPSISKVIDADAARHPDGPPDFDAVYVDVGDHTAGGTFYGDPGTTQAKSRADRAVACVNACKGINPDAVPELLAACKGLVDDVEGCELDSSMVDARNRAAAAIAKATGGAAERATDNDEPEIIGCIDDPEIPYEATRIETTGNVIYRAGDLIRPGSSHEIMRVIDMDGDAIRVQRGYGASKQAKLIDGMPLHVLGHVSHPTTGGAA